MPDLFFNNVLNRTYVKTTTSNGAVAYVKGAIVTLSTGITAYSTSKLEGLLPLYINQEDHATVTASSSFTLHKKGVTQLMGMGDCENGALLGFIDDQFGVYITRSGSRQYWQLIVAQGASAPGTITLTLDMGPVMSFSVVAGQSAMQIMQQITYGPQMLEQNLNCFMGTDRVIIISCNCDMAGDISINFGTTGVTGVCTIAAPAKTPTRTEWIPNNQFNRNSQIISKTDMSMLNIFEIKFSKVCNGSIEFSLFDKSVNAMVCLHSWTPTDLTGFNTSITYIPNIALYTTTPQDTVCTMNTSMASISSGTPVLTAMHTPYSKTWSITDLIVMANINTTIATLLNPVTKDNNRNTLLGSVAKVTISTDSTTPLRAVLRLNAQASTSVPTTSHLPWSSLKYVATSVGTFEGGYPMGNIYIKPSMNDVVETFDSFFMVPGSIFTVGLTVGDRSSTAICNNLNITIKWNEY